MDDTLTLPHENGPETETPSEGKKQAASENRTRYDMARAEAMTASAPVVPAPASAEEGVQAARPRKVAVFVAHGMGQQIPFQTLDQIAEGLLHQERTRGHRECNSNVRAVKFKDQWLSRIEMELASGTAEEVQAHIYEGYWAPLTEGEITARGVVTFLRGAAGNGIRNGSRAFQRWLFAKYREFDAPIRIVLYLMIALVTVSSLVVMNSTIVAVSAARALLAETPAWLSDGLFADLTTTFNAVVTAMALFGISVGIAIAMRKWKAPAPARTAWGLVTVALFVAVLFIVALAALAIGLLFYGHLKLNLDATRELWHGIFPATGVESFNTCFTATILCLALIAGAGLLVVWLVKIIRGVARDFIGSRSRWLTLFVALCGMALLLLGIRLALAFWNIFHGAGGSGTMGVIQNGLSWPLLVIASAYIRQVLVQYVGDVAIYVAPYKLDSFFELRNKIRDCVYTTAHAVYAQQRKDGSGPEYDQVFVVGHSLGSVVVYDVLNRLVNDDEAAGRPLDVVRRTPLLLTFGSPLDKTAFLFALQRHHTDEAREALAATLQPLVQSYGFRPDHWINIYSPWDIISGHLGFYDPPDGNDPKRVCNLVDPDASTLLTAHVEYWNNPLLFSTLHDALLGRPARRKCE